MVSLDGMAAPTFSLDSQVLKVDASQGLVLGWSVQCTQDGEPFYDSQGDHIPEDSMLAAASGFMQSARTAKAMHAGEPVGSIVFAWPMTAEVAKAFQIETPITGLMVAMKPDAESLAKFKSGEYTGFSIGGRRLLDEVVSEDGTTKMRKYDENQARDEHGRFAPGGSHSAEALNQHLASGGVVQVSTAGGKSTLYEQRHAGMFSNGKDKNLYVRSGKGKNALSFNEGKSGLVGIRLGRIVEKRAIFEEDVEKAQFGAQPRGSGQFVSNTVQRMQDEHARNEMKITGLHGEPDGKRKNAKQVAKLVGRNAELRHLMAHARTEGY